MNTRIPPSQGDVDWVQALLPLIVAYLVITRPDSLPARLCTQHRSRNNCRISIVTITPRPDDSRSTGQLFPDRRLPSRLT